MGPEMRTSTKRFSAALVTLGLSVTLVACGGSSGSSGSKSDGKGEAAKSDCPLSALPKSGSKVKISLWYGGLQGNAKTAMAETVKAYNASQDRVEVTASDQGSAYTQVLDKYTRAIPDRIPNIVYGDAATVQYMSDSGTIIPGGDCASEGVVPLDHILPVVKAFYTVDGTYIPGAVNVATPQIYYNQKQFQEAGLPLKAPGTLAEIRADGKKLKAANIAGFEWPLSMTINRWFFETFVGGLGLPMVNNGNGHDKRATKAVFDTPKAVALLKELKGMYDDGTIAKISNTSGQLQQYLNVAQGKSAMVIETSTAATTMEAFLGGKLSASDLAAGNLSGLEGSSTVAPGFGEMPGVDKPGYGPVSGGAYYVTNGGSKAQQGAAMDFIRFINQIPQQVKWHVLGSYLPSNDQVAKQPEVQELWKGKVAGLSLKVASNQLAAQSAANPGPIVGPFDQYNLIVQKMMESVFLKDADPATALAKAQADVTKAIENYNSENGF